MTQINIWQGKLLRELIEFLRAEASDVITMQEVVDGVYPILQAELSMESVFVPAVRMVGEHSHALGNAVFVRGHILEHSVIWLRPYQEYAHIELERDGPMLPRNMLDVTVQVRGQPFHVLSVHGAWGREPVDSEEKIRQARIIAEYVRRLGDTPYLLGGDFNMPSGTEVVSTIDVVSTNIVTAASVKNTLNLRKHYVAKIRPRGLAVDFIYTSKHFAVARLDVPEVDVSDHLPIRASLLFRDLVSKHSLLRMGTRMW